MSLVNTDTGEIVELDRAAAERRAERITLRLDAIADNYAAVMPMIRESIEKQDHAALGYRSVGEYVADRFGGSLQRLGVDVRRAVVGELTAAGMSTRAIAPVVGVSREAVRRDVSAIAGDNTVSPAPQTPASPSLGEDGDEAGQTPEARPVVGIDGKTYSRPVDKVAQAVREFPDLAYYAETDREQDAVSMAVDLRRFRDQGDLDSRLDNLRRSIAVDRAKRDGTYRPGTTAVMDGDGTYRMAPLPATPAATTHTCPTCNGRGVIEE